MNPKDRLRATAELLVARGWNAEAAETTAGESVENGSTLLEQLCFLRLAEHLLAKIHNPAWASNRARNPEIRPETKFEKETPVSTVGAF